MFWIGIEVLGWKLENTDRANVAKQIELWLII
jgi:hypothetical protein